MTKFQLLAVFLVPLIFLIVGLKTIPDYGINWDNSMHYNRGQAYLHYFLTGETNYLSLPKHPTLDEAIDFKDIRGEYPQIFKDAKRSTWLSKVRRSYYQSDVFNFEYFKEKDSGHPPLNGILAALTNYIFFQQLGIAGDLYSYQMFGIIACFTLILGVSIFTFFLFGTFPAIIAGSSLALYPLFLGESHFNIKDPVLASFFGLTIICFYFGVTKKSISLLIGSAIFAGFSLGTKFNTLFLPFILLPWLIFYWATVKKFKVIRKELLILTGLVVIPLVIFYITWPYLWFNGFQGLLNIFKYYASEGTGSSAVLSKYNFLGFNLFPLFWITITTPIPILALSLIGLGFLINKLIKEKSHKSLLILLWLFIPILRVTLPNTVIYGGVRHIMEYVPALAVTIGAGCYYLLGKFKKLKNSLIILMVFSLLLVLTEMMGIHPNENVYFNQIIGGLSGAKARNVPYWGNSFGNAYQQGIVWLNKNAPENSKIGLPIGGAVNLPKMNLRQDITLFNDVFSGFERKGEYEIEMSHDGLPKNTFTYAYLENFLDPVYEVKVDGVPILKVWKNDLKHTKSGFDKEKEYSLRNIIGQDNQLEIEIDREIYLTRLYLSYKTDNCTDIKNGSILISDDGLVWTVEPDPITYPQMSIKQIRAEDKNFFFLFAGKKARFIRINLNETGCMLDSPQIEVFGLQNLPN